MKGKPKETKENERKLMNANQNKMKGTWKEMNAKWKMTGNFRKWMPHEKTWKNECKKANIWNKMTGNKRKMHVS